MIECTICKQMKSLDNFGKCSRNKDGHKHQCTSCRTAEHFKNKEKNNAKSKNWRINNPERANAKVLEWKHANKERTNELNRESAARHPETYQAKNAVRRAAKLQAEYEAVL